MILEEVHRITHESTSQRIRIEWHIAIIFLIGQILYLIVSQTPPESTTDVSGSAFTRQQLSLVGVDRLEKAKRSLVLRLSPRSYLSFILCGQEIVLSQDALIPGQSLA